MTDDLSKKREEKATEKRVDTVLARLVDPTQRLQALALELAAEGLPIGQIAGSFIGHGIDILVTAGVPDDQVRQHVDELITMILKIRDGASMEETMRGLARKVVEQEEAANPYTPPLTATELAAAAKAALEDAKVRAAESRAAREAAAAEAEFAELQQEQIPPDE